MVFFIGFVGGDVVEGLLGGVDDVGDFFLFLVVYLSDVDWCFDEVMKNGFFGDNFGVVCCVCGDGDIG